MSNTPPLLYTPEPSDPDNEYSEIKHTPDSPPKIVNNFRVYPPHQEEDFSFLLCDEEGSVAGEMWVGDEEDSDSHLSKKFKVDDNDVKSLEEEACAGISQLSDLTLFDSALKECVYLSNEHENRIVLDLKGIGTFMAEWKSDFFHSVYDERIYPIANKILASNKALEVSILDREIVGNFFFVRNYRAFLVRFLHEVVTLLNFRSINSVAKDGLLQLVDALFFKIYDLCENS
jgi:hypothetical protein